MLEAYKKHPQAYFLYVEHLFLRSNVVDASPTNVHPCTFVGYEFASKLASVWNHRRPWHVQKLTSLSIFEREFLRRKNIAAD